MKKTLAILTLGSLLALAGCAPWNAVTRKVPWQVHGAALEQAIAELPPGNSPYLESNGTHGPKFGCSFIEFDGKGGFLDYQQYQHAHDVLLARAAKSNVMLVMYCHGWNNNAQSADVIRFMGFLRRLAKAGDVREQHLRVEGVYLSWRGSQYVQPIGHKDETSDQSLHEDFGGRDLVDHSCAVDPLAGCLMEPLRISSYFSIKDRAELHISRVELARAIFGLAYTVKNPAAGIGRHNRVFLVGHSFGALALEQTLGQASVALLSSQSHGYREDRWPFDLVLFLNSAAPSLYAKQLGDFLREDTGTRRPRIVSVTSTGDWATGTTHHIGNLPNRFFAADLQRKYHPPGAKGRAYTAGYYYDFTPGHNPLLVNRVVHEIVPKNKPEGATWLFGYNLATSGRTGVFYVHDTKTNAIKAYEIAPAGTDFQSNYWIVTVPPNIIPDHLKIWTDNSMEMMAGIYSIVEHIPADSPR